MRTDINLSFNIVQLLSLFISALVLQYFYSIVTKFLFKVAVKLNRLAEASLLCQAHVLNLKGVRQHWYSDYITGIGHPMTSKEIKSSLCIGGDLKRRKTAGRKKAVNRKHGKNRKNSVERKGKEGLDTKRGKISYRFQAQGKNHSELSAGKESLSTKRG